MADKPVIGRAVAAAAVVAVGLNLAAAPASAESLGDRFKRLFGGGGSEDGGGSEGGESGGESDDDDGNPGDDDDLAGCTAACEAAVGLCNGMALPCDLLCEYGEADESCFADAGTCFDALDCL